MTAGFTYVGSELELFSRAANWKAYVRAQVEPYLVGDVLEVGAGLGGTTRALCRGSERRWTCLEPDPALASRLESEVRSGSLPGCCEVRVGTVDDLDDLEAFDAILYMDVLEHIEDDGAEVARAARRLRPGGHLVALSPAHPWLFTPFDRAIGHHRRYIKATLGPLAGEGLELARMIYLDSFGLLASLGNKLVLRSAMPSPSQIAFWDRILVPISRRVDPLLGHSVGKSILSAWRKTPR